jgi:hypothetical protein
MILDDNWKIEWPEVDNEALKPRSAEAVLVKRTQVVLSVATLVSLAVLTVAVSGCRPEPVSWSELGPELQERGYREIRIEAQSNQELAELSPDDIISVMDRIGFAPEQILDYGPAMHQALRRSGAARVYVGKKVEAVLQVKDRIIFIRSSSRGSFMYNLRTGRFGMM